MLEKRLHCMTAAEPEEQWKQIKTILQETTAEVVGPSARKRQDWFDEADYEIQQLLEKKHSCNKRLLVKTNKQTNEKHHTHLMIKVPRLHARLPVVHSKLRSGLCRMIGGQHLLRGHNVTLTRETRAPCMGHSTDPRIRSKPLYALRTEIPC